MGKYIALLRGINVGGNNKVPMPELKKQFEQNGFTDVVTYINSGNVIFSSDNTNEEELKKECEILITDKFHLNIPVTIISGKDLSTALDNAPSWWNIEEMVVGSSIYNSITIRNANTINKLLQLTK